MFGTCPTNYLYRDRMEQAKQGKTYRGVQGGLHDIAYGLTSADYELKIEQAALEACAWGLEGA